MAKMKVVTYENLVNYDTKIKNLISTEDAKSIKIASIDGHTLKLYKVENPTESTVADIEIEIPETDLTEINSKINANANAISAINNETTGILATAKTYADGKVSALKDGEVKSNTDAINILNGSESTTGSVAKAVKDTKDSINATIGTVEEGKTVVQMISEAKESATYDDTAVKASIKANTDAITVLNGTGEGSVSKQVADAVASIVADAPEAYDTLKEISDWISSHAEDASVMNSQINTNKLDIASLKALVGTLPEGVASTTVVEYIAEVVGASKTELTSAIATAKSEAISSANNYSDELNTAMDTRVTDLETKTGEGFVAITEDEINALFA